MACKCPNCGNPLKIIKGTVKLVAQIDSKSFEMSEEQKKIIEALLEYGTYGTTTTIAVKAGVSWNTALKHLNFFKEQNWIYEHKQGNRSYWKGVAEK